MPDIFFRQKKAVLSESFNFSYNNYWKEASGIIFQILKILIIALSVTGGISFVYILVGSVIKNRGNLYIKGNTYLILDVDEIGEKLEYYVRKIESGIADRYIYISKIILYSKSLSKPCKSCKENQGEMYRICKILSENYNNIIFPNENESVKNLDCLLDKKSFPE